MVRGVVRGDGGSEGWSGEGGGVVRGVKRCNGEGGWSEGCSGEGGGMRDVIARGVE